MNFLDLCWGDLASRDTSEGPQEPQEIECYKAEAAIEPQNNNNVDSSFYWGFYLFLSTALYKGIIDKQPLSCSTDNRFVPLSKKPGALCS